MPPRMFTSSEKLTDAGFDNQASDLQHLAASYYHEESAFGIEARLPFSKTIQVQANGDELIQVLERH